MFFSSLCRLCLAQHIHILCKISTLPGFGRISAVLYCVFLTFSGVFELNFMSSRPPSGYYQFTVAVTGDTRFVANHVEVRWRNVSLNDFKYVFILPFLIALFENPMQMKLRLLGLTRGLPDWQPGVSFLVAETENMVYIFVHLFKNIYILSN